MAATIGGSPPIALFYSRLHDSIREELNSVHERLFKIHSDKETDTVKELQTIQQKLKFLSQVYNYHSVAEDEIVYPALDSKVKNVTLPYRIEHADEGHLLVQLMQLLMSFPSSKSNFMTTLRELACKFEEVSTTIRQHLEKEEKQLFPLLCEHFNYTEQASMIAEFLFCIPLTTVQSFLNWIQPTSCQEERNQLAMYMHHAVSDDLLLSLLDAWLDPETTRTDSRVTMIPSTMPDSDRAPLEQITNVHRGIDLSLVGFIQEARGLLEEEILGDGLESLLEKHRFLKDVCRFHMLSEEEVMFPELLKQCHSDDASYAACHQDHMVEGEWFDDLGRLLTDVRSTARRGCKEARTLLEQVVVAAETMRENLGIHMTREEKEIFPILQEKLGSGEQCLIVWRTLKMMPLRLLERVMPWISSQLNEREYAGWIAALRIGGIEDSTAVELLSRWAQRGCSVSDSMSVQLESLSVRKSLSVNEGDLHPSKRPRTDGSPRDVKISGQPNPVDHIFQFHRALLRDFRLFESETNKFVQSLEMEDLTEWKTSVQELKGRFTFIWGLYQAHSKTEDEVVFPELEKKEETKNSTHSYMLDHRQETALFEAITQMLDGLMLSNDLREVHELAMTLSRKCAAVHSTLKTHIRAEETELWPLLVEHFSVEEQQHIVGLIIGRTGAEVLQTMLPWVSSCFTEEEKEAMMGSLRKVAKNTRFDKWMENWNSPSPSVTQDPQPSVSDSLMDVAEYLRSSGLTDSSSGNFSPSFEDMFRMNQSQLEAAVRHVSSDASLEPQRKSYLIQRILASKYITKQQSKSQNLSSSSGKFIRSFSSKEKGILGCVHYQRNCALVAPCCQKVYVCRLCHDAEEDHKMNRHEVENIVCMQCGTQQPVSNKCIHCGITFALYHCSICRLYDSHPEKDIYHCQFCNICREGKGLGIDFFHCMECNACMPTEKFNKHQCRQKRIEADCPVCQENMFDSSLPIKELRCGHYMHASCFDHYSKWNYRCPFCCKSLGDMTTYFRMLDTFLASEPMPEEFKSIRQSVVCHDCGKQSNAPFHYVYHSCQHCHSYNTRLL